MSNLECDGLPSCGPCLVFKSSVYYIIVNHYAITSRSVTVSLWPVVFIYHGCVIHISETEHICNITN